MKSLFIIWDNSAADLLQSIISVILSFLSAHSISSNPKTYAFIAAWDFSNPYYFSSILSRSIPIELPSLFTIALTENDWSQKCLSLFFYLPFFIGTKMLTLFTSMSQNLYCAQYHLKLMPKSHHICLCCITLPRFISVLFLHNYICGHLLFAFLL